MGIETPQSAVADALIGKAIRLTLPGYLPATRKVAASADIALSVSLDRAPQGAPPPAPGDRSSPR